MNGAREFRIHTISIGKNGWLVTQFGMVPSSQCLGSRDRGHPKTARRAERSGARQLLACGRGPASRADPSA